MRKLVLGALIWASSAFAADAKREYQVDVPASVTILSSQKNNVMGLVCFMAAANLRDGDTINGHNHSYFDRFLKRAESGDEPQCLWLEVQPDDHEDFASSFKLACGFLGGATGSKWLQGLREKAKGAYAPAMINAWNLCQLDYDSDDDDFSRYHDCE